MDLTEDIVGIGITVLSIFLAVSLVAAAAFLVRKVVLGYHSHRAEG